MSQHSDRLELECRLRFITHAARQKPEDDSPTDLFIDGFWEGVRAKNKTRTTERLLELLAAAGAEIMSEGFAR
jgi:hypothetical protein